MLPVSAVAETDVSETEYMYRAEIESEAENVSLYFGRNNYPKPKVLIFETCSY